MKNLGNYICQGLKVKGVAHSAEGKERNWVAGCELRPG